MDLGDQLMKYLTASEAIEILKIPSATFYRFVKEGKIKKYYPTAVSKHGMYDPKEIARLSSKFRREAAEQEKSETDWVKSSDMGSIYDLEYTVYGDETGDPSIIRKWYERNPYMCRVLYNQSNRRDLWGALNIVPLTEETILKLLRGEMRDVDLDPQKDILTYEQPGIYNFYVASVIVRKERKHHFIQLLNSYFDFWCSLAPERVVGRIYGRVLSESGEMLARKLFFSPLWHISDTAFVLDMAKPNPSRIVQSFQYCIKTKSEEAAETDPD
ncbi:DNA-binding protein [Ktedonosporobacter rubrisoli]|uniref:DNA-binding protein n=1 Tax=Ktedonosporobacter rubrisoli TaxID=2509675 RepID=A0A4V0YY28_KTERU|nr:helix-turn-helix domain-containing protein [Ktedonosporobacter rubrisoli]QBD74771.1 DNA-binding protein [Ktedonosporobacter rubrisoli]